MAITYNTDVYCDATGRDLGQTSSRWDLFAQNVDISGTITLGSAVVSTTGAITSSAAVTGNTLVSTVATGTAPLTVASTTQVTNLNASTLISGTWAIPGSIGATTPNAGAFTTLSASGVLTSTVSTGTAPFTVASTTQVSNLNVTKLVGGDWASPVAIGTGTPAAATFTTCTGNTSVKIGSGGTALTQCVVYTQSITPSSVSANTSATQTATVTGLTTADKIIAVNPPSMTAGTGLVAAWASSGNTISLQWANFTVGALTPASGSYQIVALRS